MVNLLVVIFCMAAGYFLKKYKKLPADSHKAVNAWLINIALPCIALKYLPTIPWSTELLLPLTMPFVVWFGSVFFVYLLKKRIPMDKTTATALILVTGLGNTSFLGFPLSKAYYDEAGLQIAVLCDQACFIITSTLGVIAAVNAGSTERIKPKILLKRVITFPPFIASVLALSTSSFIDFSVLDSFLSKISATLVPMALFSVGLQLSIKDWRADRKLIFAGLGYKLLLAPLVILIIVIILNANNLIGKVSILEAAMAPMVTGAILASDHNLNSRLSNMILSIGTPLSLITTAIWVCISQLLS